MSSPNVQKTPEKQSSEAAERLRVAFEATAPASQSAAPTPKAGEAAVAAAMGISPEDLEAEILRILGARAKPTGPKPPEIDWANLTEEQATDLNIALNIPIIEHEVPAYMDVKLKDPLYVTVWVNRDQRRMGEVLAQGYEPIKAEHIAGDFKTPLRFDSEGLYTYMDVIAMRVHKKILFAKRRAVVEKSFYQLKALRTLSEQKVKNKVDDEDPLLGNAFRSGRMGFYSTDTDSREE